MKMTEVVEQACVSEDKQSKKEFLYKPFEGKKKEWVAMVQNLIDKNTNEKLTDVLNRMSHAEEIPIKWNKINKPKFLNFVKHIMENQDDCVRDEQLWNLIAKDLKEKSISKSKKNTSKPEKKITAKEKQFSGPVIVAEPVVKATPITTVVKATPVIPAVLPESQKNQNYSKRKETEWATIIQNLIQINTNEELTSALQKISKAKNIPHVKKWDEIRKAKFENFLNNIPGYEVNPIIDEQLRILISKARQEQQIKKRNEKYLSKGFTAKPVNNERNSEWLTLFRNLIQQAVENSEELPSDAFQRIIQNGEIPKICKGIKKPDFEKFLKNKLDCEVNPKVEDQLWNLISKALEEQRANAKILVNKKARNEIKAAKRKSDIENEKPADNHNRTSMKRIKEEVETKSGDSESCDPVNGATTIVYEGVQQPNKVKWNSIGKTILLARDAKEMSLKKFQKIIIAEYLRRVGDAGSDESVEVLWGR